MPHFYCPTTFTGSEVKVVCIILNICFGKLTKSSVSIKHTRFCHVMSCGAVLVSTSHHITSHHITSHHITSHHITSHHITSHHITSHHITSHHITSHHITSHHITSHHITSHHITSHHITSHQLETGVMAQNATVAVWLL